MENLVLNCEILKNKSANNVALRTVLFTLYITGEHGGTNFKYQFLANVARTLLFNTELFNFCSLIKALVFACTCEPGKS